MRSLQDVQLLPNSYHSPCQPASPRPSVRPPQFQLGDETMADTTRSAGYSDQSQHSDHSGHHRSESCSSIGSRRSRSPGASDDAAPPKAGSVRQEEIISGVFDVQIKPRDPPTFSGRTQEDPEMWVGQMSNFFSPGGRATAEAGCICFDVAPGHCTGLVATEDNGQGGPHRLGVICKTADRSF